MADDKLVTHLVLDGVGGYMKGLSRVEYGLNAGAKAAEDFRKRTARISEAANAVGAAGMKMAMAGGAVVLGLGAMGAKAAEFDKAMRNVNSIARLSETEFQNLRADVLALAADPHILDGPTKLAEGLYQIQSSGFSGALGLKVLEVAAKGGAAGMSDTFTAASALAGIMNAYNQKTGPDAERIMDTLFKTVELGVVTFEELAQTIGPAAAIAAQAGVPLEQVAAATTVMTKRGIDAAMTMTSLTRIMTAFLDPPKELAARLQDLTGETGATILRTRGLGGAIEVLGQIAGNQPEVLAQIGLEARALRAAMSLTGSGAAEFANDLAGIEGAAGAAGQALAEQAKSQAHGWEQLKKTLEIVAVTFGNVAAGPMNEVATKLAAILGAISKLPPWMKATIVYLAGGAGLVVLFAGLALKLGATVVQTWLSIAATRAYVSKLREEALAAKLAAAAEMDLAKARGLTWAMTGKKPTSGPSPIPPVVTPLPGGPLAVPVGLGVLIAALILAGAKGIQLALRLRDLRKDLDALTDPVQRVRRELEELEWLQADPAAQKLLSRANKERLQAAIDANRAYLANVDAARAEATAVAFAATDEGRRLEALGKRKDELRDLLKLQEMTKAQEAAGLATEQQVGAVRSAVLQNMLAQWGLLTKEERESAGARKFALDYYSQLADDVNAKEEDRKQLLEDQTRAIENQTRAIEDQLGLLDARVGYAQAYAEYLEASGQRGEARRVRREVIPGLQQRAAWQQFGAMREYAGMGERFWPQALQAGGQGWRYMAEAAQGGRGRLKVQVNMRNEYDWSKVYDEHRERESMGQLVQAN